MPKIQALIDAEAMLAAVESNIAPLRVIRAQCHAELEALDAKIEAATAEAREQVARAKALQSVALTKWTMDPGRTGSDPSFQRFVICDGSPCLPWFDGRAWLRRMCLDGGKPSESRWRWTLDAGKRVILDPREQDPNTPAPSIEAMQAAADAVLIGEGYILTDLEYG